MSDEEWVRLGSQIDSARHCYDGEDYHEAIKLYETILKSDVLKYNDRATVMAELGYCYHEIRDYQSAIKKLRLAEELDEVFRNKSGFNRVLGSCYFQIGNYLEALNYRKKAFDLSSDPEEKKLLLFQVGRSHLFVGNGKSAKKYLKNYLKALSEEHKDEKMDAMYNLGFAYMQLKKLKEAEKSFYYLIDNKRDNGDLARGYYGLTELFYHMHKFDKVINCTEKVIEYDDRFSERETVLFYQIVAYLEKGDKTKAAELAKEFNLEYPESKHTAKFKDLL